MSPHVALLPERNRSWGGSGFREMEVWFKPSTYEVLDRKKQSAHKTLLAKRLQTSSRPSVLSQRGAHMALAGVHRLTGSPPPALGLHSLTHTQLDT
jgi:hypothetical protein